MSARHDDMDMVAASQRKAAEKYQKKYIVQYSLKLNVRYDRDIKRRLSTLQGESMNAYLKRLIREDIARMEQEKEKENPGNNE